MVKNFFHLSLPFFFFEKKNTLKKATFAFSVLSFVLYILCAYIKKVMKPRKIVYVLLILLRFFLPNYVFSEWLCYVYYTILYEFGVEYAMLCNEELPCQFVGTDMLGFSWFYIQSSFAFFFYLLSGWLKHPLGATWNTSSEGSSCVYLRFILCFILFFFSQACRLVIYMVFECMAR